MLDDLKYIHQRDGQDALGIAEKQWRQYTHKFNIDWSDGGWLPKAVMVAGMGGSALAATALSAVPGLDVAFEVVRDYDLPKHVDNSYLLICSSYSGNTEETLSIANKALSLPESKRPRIVCISSGGKLQKIAKEQGFPLVNLPGGYQPRFTFGYQYSAVAQLFEKAGLVKGLVGQVEQGAEIVKKVVESWRPDVSSKENLAKQIALELAGKSAVIYSGPKMFPAAYKWKISLNETAKNVAWCNQYPEFNHNEFMGWTSHPIQKPYGVVELRSQYDHPQIQKRFEISDRLLSGRRPAPIIVNIPKGVSQLEDLMWAVALGDFVSIYLALANGVNPTPVDLIEKLKAELK
ncbi:bifunctional phosphoglucose/phosphomannose isomerase [Candidatus Saccharibacteria bacterium CG10_big_fil_rev_8_21_14_0_10_47_8]|nr:MAG: bifunctional phosphoglucose/phosphomannose isomerase [Candidatus Saccharibacteria bacterium CG10_big_fil_rev_8_21_14_0_10_47_8]